uniref:Uncharacterized protein n=1 Tax=Serratia phage Spe5P4 TaxID=3159438 RepID=A0AAU7VH19_9CAUD
MYCCKPLIYIWLRFYIGLLITLYKLYNRFNKL